MSIQDPIADMLTRIRNAQAVNKHEVHLPMSKVKLAVANVLKDEGYIVDYQAQENDGKPKLVLILKYFEGKPVIQRIESVSRPSMRIYKDKRNLPSVMNGLGIAIISTSKGLMSDRKARQLGEGGEVLCYVC
jgi:small subunit ribosomal protein S8